MAEEYPLSTPTSDERTMGILAHILALVIGILGPLIIYLIKKDESQFVRENAKESLNFQITMLLCYFVSGILIFAFIGFFLIGLLVLADLVLVIIASIKVSENKIYRYPFNIRFIK